MLFLKIKIYIKKLFFKVFPILGLFFLIVGLFFTFNQISVFTTERVNINNLNILGIKCVFPGQTGCDSGDSLFGNVINFVVSAAPYLAGLVIAWGGYQYFFGALANSQADGKKTIIAGSIGLIIVLTSQVFRSVIERTISVTDGQGTFTAQPVIELFGQASDFLYFGVGMISVFVFIIGGYQYLTSALPGEQKNGMKAIQAGVSGLLVVILARPIQNFIQTTFNFTPDGSGNGTLVFSQEAILKLARDFFAGFAIPVSTVVTIFFIVVGGYYYITGQDIEKGKKSIINAFIGLLIIILSSTIVALLSFFIPDNIITPPSQDQNYDKSVTIG